MIILPKHWYLYRPFLYPHKHIMSASNNWRKRSLFILRPTGPQPYHYIKHHLVTVCEYITYQSGWGPKGLRYSYHIRTFHQTNLWNPSLQTQFVEASGQAKIPLSFLYQALVVIEWIHFLPILSFYSWIHKLMYPSLHCLYCSQYRYFLSLEHVDQNRVYLLFNSRLGRLMLRIQLP